MSTAKKYPELQPRLLRLPAITSEYFTRTMKCPDFSVHKKRTAFHNFCRVCFVRFPKVRKRVKQLFLKETQNFSKIKQEENKPMKHNPMLKWIGAAGLGLMLCTMVAPGAQALTVNAFVVRQSCINGDIVAVTLSATVQPAQQVRYRWDFTNNGSFDTLPSFNPTVHPRYRDERRITARVMAVNARGVRAFDTVTFMTRRCGGGG
jgi:hypothetical protein